MSEIEKKCDQTKLVNSKKKMYKESNTVNKNISSLEGTKNDLEYNSNNIIKDNKKIVLDTSVNITVELGKSKIKIKDFLSFSTGSILILDKLKEEPLDIFINGYLIASGEIVFLENKYGLRITNIKRSVKSMNFPV